MVPDKAVLIANTITHMRDNLAGTSNLLMVLNHPEFPAILHSYGIDPGSTMEFGCNDGTKHPPLDIHESVARIRDNPHYNLDYVGVFLMATVTLIADRLSRNSYFNKTPELEFLRLIRNAVAHGNHFNLKPDEPKRPARFQGFEISQSLNGTELFWQFMGPGDVLDLLDEVQFQLRALSADFALGPGA